MYRFAAEPRNAVLHAYIRRIALHEGVNAWHILAKGMREAATGEGSGPANRLL